MTTSNTNCSMSTLRMPLFFVVGILGACCGHLVNSPCGNPFLEGPDCRLDGSGVPCKTGYICTPSKGRTGGGVCCRIPEDVCRKGSLQGPTCSLRGLGIPCKSGYTCTSLIFGHGLGVCCSDIRPGTCPTPRVEVGPCIFVPGVNCLSDVECPPFYKCCSEGCGSICKRVIFGAVNYHENKINPGENQEEDN